MSLKLSAVCWELQLTQAQRTVLKALADSADDDGSHCYPGIPYLAWKTDYDERSVRRILRDLETRGYIEVVAEATAPGEFTQYQLHFDRIPRKPPFVKKRGSKLPPLRAKRGGISRRDGGHFVPGGGTFGTAMGDISSLKNGELGDGDGENTIRSVVNPDLNPDLNPLKRTRGGQSAGRSGVRPVPKPSAVEAAERAACPVHAAMVAVIGGEPLTVGELAEWDAARLDAVARALAAGQGREELAGEYRVRGERYKRIWPHLALSAVAVWRRWTVLAHEPRERGIPRAGERGAGRGQAGMFDPDKYRAWRNAVGGDCETEAGERGPPGNG